MNRDLNYEASLQFLPSNALAYVSVPTSMSIARLGQVMAKLAEFDILPVTIALQKMCTGPIPESDEYWMKYRMAAMRLSRSVIVLTDGDWNESEEVQADIAVAKHLNIAIVYIDPYVILKTTLENSVQARRLSV